MLRLTPILLITGLVLVSSGCGVDEYESLMKKRLAVLQEVSRFEALTAPTQLGAITEPASEGDEPAEASAGLPITIRLPKMFKEQDDWFNAKSNYRGTNDVPMAERVFPPFMTNFPGHERTGEQFAPFDDQTKLSYYCYVGVVEARTMKLADVMSTTRLQAIKAKLPEVSVWQDVECHDEQLRPTTWKMFEAKGQQLFDNPAGVRPHLRTLPGVSRLYVREDQGYIILWGVRVPDALAGKVFLMDLADAVAGTVKVTAPAPTAPLPKPVKKPNTPTKKPDAKSPEKTDGEAIPKETQPDGAAPEKKPVDEKPNEEKPADEKPAQEAPPADEKATDEKPVEKATDMPPADEAPADEAPADEAPK